MSALSDDEKIEEIARVLQDQSRPLKERFRALFTLRNLGGERAIDSISQCFEDPSALLKHELAYCLGQMKDEYAIPVLTRILEDTSREAIVRHEAGASYFPWLKMGPFPLALAVRVSDR
jgi:deoxyhypusine monooxygenase